jgi:3-phenylpropionate/trans-cinnamate dioxygenase ferredoxin component
MSEAVDLEQFTFYRIGPAAEVSNGERIFFDIGNFPIMLLNVGGQFYAIGDVCTHDDGPLGDGDLDGYEIICPRHGAHFDVRTGQATRRPAFAPTPWYPVRLVEGFLEVGIPK